MNDTTANVMQEAIAERFAKLATLRRNDHEERFSLHNEIRDLIAACDYLGVECRGFKDAARSFIDE